MSSPQLETLKQQAATLTDEERQELIQFLVRSGVPDSGGGTAERSNNAVSKQQNHQQHLVWLKTHREKYAGQYVALDGQRLVGQGKTLREAREQAMQYGIEAPFLVRVSSEQEVLPAGL